MIRPQQVSRQWIHEHFGKPEKSLPPSKRLTNLSFV
ncbi:DUF6392 family protein [Photorhabdus laumondii]